MSSHIVSVDADAVPTKPPADQAVRGTNWQDSMRSAFRDPLSLLEYLELPQNPAELNPAFPLFVTREFAGRMRPGDLHDPLLRQVLPIAAERISSAGFQRDPVGDDASRRSGALLKKYEGRALWVMTGVCPIHCRYCFRQHFDYSTSASDGVAETEWLQSQPDVEEVILSGGDPLALADDKLRAIVTKLEPIPHLLRLRIHTRMPVMIPRRVTSELIDILQRSRLTTWIVVHINHAAEIDNSVAEALGRLIDAGIPVLNQSVLLAGVNDSEESLIALSKRLIDVRVIPYYLHQLDRVEGAAHFEVSDGTAKQLMAAIRARLPGYAVPQLVREVAGAKSKLPVV